MTTEQPDDSKSDWLPEEPSRITQGTETDLQVTVQSETRQKPMDCIAQATRRESKRID